MQLRVVRMLKEQSTQIAIDRKLPLEGKWIVCHHIADKEKTSVYAVRTKEKLETLGLIKWYGGFRKYSFYPYMEAIFETTCLRDIARFCEELTADHKARTSHPKEISGEGGK